MAQRHFQDDPEVLTVSIHCEQISHLEKLSDHDCGLAVGAGDQECLTEVERALVLAQEFKPDAVFYIAGAIPLSTIALVNSTSPTKG